MIKQHVLKQQKSIAAKQERRTRHPVWNHPDNHSMFQGASVINFCSNDYLGLGHEPTIAQQFADAALKTGFGSGASTAICGYHPWQQQLEDDFAQWLGFERAILFNSGYCANLGVLTALLSRQTYALADKVSHASLLDGLVLSRSQYQRYRHCSLEHLKHLVAQRSPDMIISESVFSMEGTIAPLNDVAAVAKAQQALLLVDDAHGIGVLGKAGGGVIEHFSLSAADIDCLVLPLGKAFNGVGAMVLGSDWLIEAVLQFARTQRYTTALPPAICQGLNRALHCVQQDHWRREKLQQNIAYFKARASVLAIPLHTMNATPIQLIAVGDNMKALKLQQQLLDAGFYVVAIRPPTVPDNTARLRLSLNARHTAEQIESLLQCVAAGIGDG